MLKAKIYELMIAIVIIGETYLFSSTYNNMGMTTALKPIKKTSH